MGVKAIEAKFDAKALKKALRPMGEWSTTEITCAADGSISVKVNGTPVPITVDVNNTGTITSVNASPLGTSPPFG